MKHAHTLLAATLAGLSAAALADVTVYGAIDETLESVSARGAANSSKNIGQTTRVNSNSSLIGFKGSEDLGNGLKAIWQVESGVAIDCLTAWRRCGRCSGICNPTPCRRSGFSSSIPGQATSASR